MINPFVAVLSLVVGILLAWIVTWYVTDLVVGSRKAQAVRPWFWKNREPSAESRQT